MRRKGLVATVFLLAVAMGFCDPGAALTFDASVGVNACNEFSADLAVRNDGDVVFAGDDTFDAIMILHHQGGELCVRSEIHALSAVEPHGVVRCAFWCGALDPGAYRLVWGAPGYGYSEITFDLVERNGRLGLDNMARFQVRQDALPISDNYRRANPKVEQAIDETL